MIEIKNLKIALYNHGGFNDLNLIFKTGKSYTITGESGSGKTLLFSLLSGILDPDEGDIIIDGQSILYSKVEVIREARKKLGIIFQVPGIISNLTVFENLKLVADFYFPHKTPKEKEHMIEIELAHFNLLPVVNLRPDFITRNQLFLVSAIRAFISQCKILLWDAPYVSLDERYHKYVEARMAELKKDGCTMIYFTNNFELARRHSDHIYQIEQGRIVIV